MQGWDDLKRRLAANRRLFGFFHPSLPAEPLVLLHTALTRQVPATMQDVLSQAPGAIYVSPDDWVQGNPSKEIVLLACMFILSGVFTPVAELADKLLLFRHNVTRASKWLVPFEAVQAVSRKRCKCCRFAWACQNRSCSDDRPCCLLIFCETCI